MALWHYKFELVPSGTEEPKDKLITDDGFIPEVEVNWESNRLGKNVLEFVENNFKSTDSWSDEILMFGTKDNRIDFGLTEGTSEIEYIHCQFDLRDNDWKSFIHKIIYIAKLFRLYIYDFYSFNIFEPTIEEFKESIVGSNAFRALTNPDEFFKSVANGQET